MTFPFKIGGLTVRFADGEADRALCRALRASAFGATEADRFDDLSRLLMIEDAEGALLSTLRLRLMPSGAGMQAGYVGQYHDLSPLACDPRPMMEVGRFCVAPGLLDPDILRLAWGALARVVDAEGVALLFGVTSFPGTDPAPHAAVFRALAARHLGPPALRPTPGRGQAACRFDALPPALTPPGPMPSLMRSYLALGGWTADYAVVDRDLGTLQVFTALDVSAVPPARARALRGLAR